MKMAWLAFVVAACGGQTAAVCQPTDQMACTCGSKMGFASCVDGQFSVCDCDCPTIVSMRCDDTRHQIVGVDSCGNDGVAISACPCGCADATSCKPVADLTPISSDPSCEDRSSCLTMEYVGCQLDTASGQFIYGWKTTNTCVESISCVGYATDVDEELAGFGTSCTTPATDVLPAGYMGHAYSLFASIAACQATEDVPGPMQVECVSASSPSTCLPSSATCPVICN
jgi:hypothetical protein